MQLLHIFPTLLQNQGGLVNPEQGFTQPPFAYDAKPWSAAILPTIMKTKGGLVNPDRGFSKPLHACGVKLWPNTNKTKYK